MSGRYLLADFCSDLKNCHAIFSRTSFVVEANKLCVAVADLLKQSGYIAKYEVKTVNDNGRMQMVVFPRFDKYTGKNVIKKIQFISKPSCRRYYKVDDIKAMKIRNGFSKIILTSSIGVIDIDYAIKHNVGGEVLCIIS